MSWPYSIGCGELARESLSDGSQIVVMRVTDIGLETSLTLDVSDLLLKESVRRQHRIEIHVPPSRPNTTSAPQLNGFGSPMLMARTMTLQQVKWAEVVALERYREPWDGGEIPTSGYVDPADANLWPDTIRPEQLVHLEYRAVTGRVLVPDALARNIHARTAEASAIAEIALDVADATRSCDDPVVQRQLRNALRALRELHRAAQGLEDIEPEQEAPA